jgi:hypothetical protein
MRTDAARWALPAGTALCIAGAFGSCNGPAPSRAASAAIAPAIDLRDGFEAAVLAPFWLPGDHGSGRYAPGAVVLTDECARSGRRSARITVRQGDVAQLGDSGQPNERAELDSGKHALLGRQAWCSFSFLVPPGFPLVDTRLVLSQWKQSGLPGSPIVAQRYVAGRHYVTIRDLGTRGGYRARYELPPIEPGRWHDMLWRVRFGDESTGEVEVWMNGRPVVHFRGATADAAGRGEFYHKLGLYRDRMAEPMTIFVDDYALGESREAVEAVDRP